MSASKKQSILSLLSGALVLLSCELPIILSVVGLGAFTATAEMLRPPFWLEVIGVIALTLGCLGLGWYAIKHFRNRQTR